MIGKKTKPTACKEHNLPYLAFHSDAERRHKRGERQVWCSLCQKWTWPEHVSDDHRPHTMTKRQFDRAVRESEKKYVLTLHPPKRRKSDDAKGGG